MKTKRILALLFLIANLAMLQACKTKTSSQNQASTQEIAMHSKNMVPYEEGEFEPGCKLLPKAALEKEIAKAQRAKAVWKIPVVVKRAQIVGPRRTFVGLVDGFLEADLLEISVDDSRLGISFDDRLPETCLGDVPCQMWVVGSWGPELEIEGFSSSAKLVFTIHAVTTAPEGAATKQEDAVVYLKR